MDTPVLAARTYVLAYLALLILLGVSAGIGHLDFGWGSMFIAVTIAVCQASIVTLILMHSLFESVFVKLAIAAGLIWLLILVTLTMTDYITRNWVPVAGK